MNSQNDSGFSLKRIIEEPVTHCPRGQSPEARRYSSRDGFEAAIPAALFERLVRMAEVASPDEFVGLLLGRLCRDERGTHVQVEEVMPDPDAIAGPTTVATTPGSEAAMRERARLFFPDLIPLGWVHSHPGYGTHFSATDLETQRSWTRPHSVGVVVDPTTRELGVYRGPRAERLSPKEATIIDPPRSTFVRPSLPPAQETPQTQKAGWVPGVVLVAAICVAGLWSRGPRRGSPLVVLAQSFTPPAGPSRELASGDSSIPPTKPPGSACKAASALPASASLSADASAQEAASEVGTDSTPDAEPPTTQAGAVRDDAETSPDVGAFTDKGRRP